MVDHWFISYSSVDSREFVLQLADKLSAGPPIIPVWLDQRELRPTGDWDEQIEEALQTCKGLLFVMTPDSVQHNSVCKNEWVRALKDKKPIVPLLKERGAKLPFRLSSRQYIDFTAPWESALAGLRNHLTWVDSPAGQLQALKDCLADAQRELPRAQLQEQEKIQDDIAELQRQIAQQQAVVDNPQAAAQRTQESIEQLIPVKGKRQKTDTRFLEENGYLANRHEEVELFQQIATGQHPKRILLIQAASGLGKTNLLGKFVASCPAGVSCVSIDLKSAKELGIPYILLFIRKRLGREHFPRFDAQVKEFQRQSNVQVTDNRPLAKVKIKSI
jgi:hypothetical protein